MIKYIVWLKAPSLTIRVWRRRKDILTMDHSPSHLVNYLITKVFVEQPPARPGSANNATWHYGNLTG